MKEEIEKLENEEIIIVKELTKQQLQRHIKMLKLQLKINSENVEKLIIDKKPEEAILQEIKNLDIIEILKELKKELRNKEV